MGRKPVGLVCRIPGCEAMNTLHTANGGDTVEDGRALPREYELTPLGWVVAFITIATFVVGAYLKL